MEKKRKLYIISAGAAVLLIILVTLLIVVFTKDSTEDNNISSNNSSTASVPDVNVGDVSSDDLSSELLPDSDNFISPDETVADKKDEASSQSSSSSKSEASNSNTSSKKPSSSNNSSQKPTSSTNSSSKPSSSAKKDYFDISGLTGTQADVGKVVGYSSMFAENITVVSVVERTSSDGRKVIQTNYSDGTVTKVIECEYCHKFPCPSGGGEKCSEYNAKEDAAVTCQTCGRPRGDGYNGTCKNLIDWDNGGKVSCNHYD